jgi:hypothetical protein
MTVYKSTLVTLFIWPDIWPKMVIDKVITVFSNGFYATVISNALTELKDGVPGHPI